MPQSYKLEKVLGHINFYNFGHNLVMCCVLIDENCGINGWPNEISVNHSYDSTTIIVSKVMIVNKLGPIKASIYTHVVLCLSKLFKGSRS